MNSTPKIEIRRAELSDVANLAVLKQQVWIATYAVQGIRTEFSNYVLSEFTMQKVSRSITDDNRVTFIAEIDNHCIGCIEIALNTECPVASVKAPEITILYVLERFLGRGIGKMLLDEASDALKRMNIDAVWLTVYYLNERAISFYEHNGFIEIGKAYFEMDGNRYENKVMVHDIELKLT